MVDQRAIESDILKLLPKDGSAVLNRVMMALIGARLSARIEADTYFDSVEHLAATGIVGRQRGQGGKIYLCNPVALNEPAPRSEEWPEPKLMPNLGHFLKSVFFRGLDLPSNACFKVVDTSMHGPQEKWGRPDFTVVSILPLQVLPYPQLDVHAFELKAEAAGDITSVHQALAQTRMTHFGTLVWHLPETSSHATRLAGVVEQCRSHGIGLILIRDPEVLETWSIEVDPVRQATAAADIDSFLAARLNSIDNMDIRDALSGGKK